MHNLKPPPGAGLGYTLLLQGAPGCKPHGDTPLVENYIRRGWGP